MKKTKKLLSVLLAVLMVFSVAPMAFAAECPHTNKTQVVEIAPIEGTGRTEPQNIYETVIACEDELAELTQKYSDGSFVCGDCGEKIIVKRADYSEHDVQCIRCWAIFACMPSYFGFKEGFDPLNFVMNFEGTAPSGWCYTLSENRQADVDKMTGIYKTLADVFEENMTLNLMGMKEVEYAKKLLIKEYGNEAFYAVYNKVEESYAAEEDEAYNNFVESATQEAGDAYVFVYRCMITDTEACLSGEHCEIINITENEDGTKTGTCSRCGETVVVKEKGDCKHCGETHDNFFGKVLCFFKSILDYIKNLFSSKK